METIPAIAAPWGHSGARPPAPARAAPVKDGLWSSRGARRSAVVGARRVRASTASHRRKAWPSAPYSKHLARAEMKPRGDRRSSPGGRRVAVHFDGDAPAGPLSRCSGDGESGRYALGRVEQSRTTATSRSPAESSPPNFRPPRTLGRSRRPPVDGSKRCPSLENGTHGVAGVPGWSKATTAAPERC